MEEEKRKRKRGGDIDDIFGEGRKKSQEKQKAREKQEEEEKRRIENEARAKDEMKVALGLQRKSKYRTDGIDDPKIVRKRTEEGFRIYKEDELHMNRGGKTALCPFDCDCCY